MLIKVLRTLMMPSVLSSRANGAADGAPNDWRRALLLQPSAEGLRENSKDVFT
jgi:hypothetical protein